MDQDKIEEQVNKLVTQGTIPDDTPPEIAFAARAEIRRRDTQSSYTKNQQRLRQLEHENAQLAKSWEQDASTSLTPQQQTRLEELKTQDPDKWRQEITALEQQRKTEIATQRAQISRQAQLDMRTQQLEEYNSQNPQAQITDEAIQNDIPPRLTRQLEQGDITFEDFLQASKKYLTPATTPPATPTPPKDPGFADSRGSSSPSEEALNYKDKDDYNQEIY